MNVNKKPTIDILFPYYGDIKMMKKAVNSVLLQNYKNWVLKVFDDGYPSTEPENFFRALITKEIAERGNTRIIYEKNARNLGANGNFRKALENATNNYFVMMGADDIMHADFLSSFISVIEKENQVDIYQPMVDIINENDKSYLPLVDKIKRRIMPKKTGLYQGETIAKTLIHGWHYFPAMIWKTALAQRIGFDMHYNVSQDLNLALNIIQEGGNFYFDRDRTTFSYRRHAKSDSSVKAIDGVRFIEEKQFYNNKAKEFQGLGWKKAKIVAKHHYFSRLNSLSLLSKSIRRRNNNGNTEILLKHIANLD